MAHPFLLFCGWLTPGHLQFQDVASGMAKTDIKGQSSDNLYGELVYR